MDLANPYEMKSLCRSTGVLAQISFPLNTSRRVLHNFRLRDYPEWRLPIRVCACGGGIIFKNSGAGLRRGGPPRGVRPPLPPTGAQITLDNTSPGGRRGNCEMTQN